MTLQAECGAGSSGQGVQRHCCLVEGPKWPEGLFREITKCVSISKCFGICYTVTCLHFTIINPCFCLCAQHILHFKILRPYWIQLQTYLFRIRFCCLGFWLMLCEIRFLRPHQGQSVAMRLQFLLLGTLPRSLPSFLKEKPFIRQFRVFNNYPSTKACLTFLVYRAAG